MKKTMVLVFGITMVFLTYAGATEVGSEAAGNEVLARATPVTVEGAQAKVAFEQLLRTGATESTITKGETAISTISGSVGGDQGTCTKLVVSGAQDSAQFSCEILYNW